MMIPVTSLSRLDFKGLDGRNDIGNWLFPELHQATFRRFLRRGLNVTFF